MASRTRSMTEGSPLKLMLRFALPLLLGNLFQQTYNMMDAMIVGRILGSNALAGVGATTSVQFLVFGFCMGVCSGFGIPIAQRFGAEDHRDMRRFIWHSLVMTAVLAFCATVLTTVFTPQILDLLSTPDNIRDDAYAYLFIIFLGIPFTLLYNLLSSILRAVGDSRTPFLFLAVSTVLNIALDLFCILVLELGVAGAAIATVTAQAVSGILCLILIVRKYEILWIAKDERRWDQRHMRMLITMGVPMGLQYSITAIGSMVMQSANNSLGSVYVSGFTAGAKLKQLTMCPFDAIANAIATFAGQNYGAGKPDRIRKGFRQGLLLSIAYGIGIGLVMFFFGRTCSMLFISASETEVLDAAGLYIGRIGLFYWSLAILNVSRMTTQGLGFSGRTILSGAIEMVARIIVSLFFVPVFGFGAITFADQAAWLAADLYILPMCLHCIGTASKKISRISPKIG